jgi:hypothetical protein
VLSHPAVLMQINRLVSGYYNNSLFYKTNVEARQTILFFSLKVKTVTNQIFLNNTGRYFSIVLAVFFSALF